MYKICNLVKPLGTEMLRWFVMLTRCSDFDLLDVIESMSCHAIDSRVFLLPGATWMIRIQNNKGQLLREDIFLMTLVVFRSNPNFQRHFVKKILVVFRSNPLFSCFYLPWPFLLNVFSILFLIFSQYNWVLKLEKIIIIK